MRNTQRNLLQKYGLSSLLSLHSLFLSSSLPPSLLLHVPLQLTRAPLALRRPASQSLESSLSSNNSLKLAHHHPSSPLPISLSLCSSLATTVPFISRCLNPHAVPLHASLHTYICTVVHISLPLALTRLHLLTPPLPLLPPHPTPPARPLRVAREKEQRHYNTQQARHLPAPPVRRRGPARFPPPLMSVAQATPRPQNRPSINKENREQTLQEAEEKLRAIRAILKDVAEILKGHARLQYARSFSPGTDSRVPRPGPCSQPAQWLA